MDFFRVVNWEKHQHYKDRCPPWIKVQNALLSHYEFGLLPDTCKAHLVLIWLLASKLNNKIPYDQKWIERQIQATSKVRLEELESSGFIESYRNGSNLLAEGKQSARLETETEERQRKRQTKDSWAKQFEKFWSVYLKKRGREQAKKAWAKLAHDDVEVDTILTALVWQFQQDDWTKEKHQFAPNGSTYLNNKRWEDEPEQLTGGGQHGCMPDIR